MQVHRASSTLRTELFTNLDRDITNKLLVGYTNHVPDPRIDADFVDYTDASRGFFGCSHHYVIGTRGRIEVGRDPRTCSTNTKQRRMHREAIHIGVVGGLATETGYRVATITDAQNEAVEWLIQAIADTLVVPLELTDNLEHWAASRSLTKSNDVAAAIAADTYQRLYDAMTDDELAASDDRLSAYP